MKFDKWEGFCFVLVSAFWPVCSPSLHFSQSLSNYKVVLSISLYSFVHLLMQIHGCAGSQSVPAPVLTDPSERDGVPKISLPVFGLAYYKFKPSSWIPNEGGARQLLNSLLQNAENWLSSLRVNHPDFLFFRRR